MKIMIQFSLLLLSLCSFQGLQAQAADQYNFTDLFTGPDSPFLTIDDEYSYGTGGLVRDSSGPRPLNFTITDDFLTGDFEADLTVSSPATTEFDIIFFGFGDGQGPRNGDNELMNALMFRIHSYRGAGQQIDVGFWGNGVVSNFGWVILDKLRTFSEAWDPVAGDTFRISKTGDAIRFSMLSDLSDFIELSITAVESAASRGGSFPDFSFDPDNSHIFFGNGTSGTVFHDLTVRDTGVPLDSDGDGVPDPDDACVNSILSTTLEINGVDTGVSNVVGAEGCSVADELELACSGDFRNHGQFVSCVADFATDLRRSGVISGRERGAIVRTAAKK